MFRTEMNAQPEAQPKNSIILISQLMFPADWEESLTPTQKKLGLILSKTGGQSLMPPVCKSDGEEGYVLLVGKDVAFSAKYAEKEFGLEQLNVLLPEVDFFHQKSDSDLTGPFLEMAELLSTNELVENPQQLEAKNQELKECRNENAFLEKTIKDAGINPLKIPQAQPTPDHRAETKVVRGIAQLRKDAEYSKIVEFCQAEKGTYVEIARKVLNGFHVGREFKGQIAPLSSLTIGAICRKKTFNSDVIVRELNSLNSIEEGKKYLTKSCKCKDEYEKVAMYLGIISSSGTFSSKTICKLKNSILEMTIGYRIRAAAIQG